MPKLLLGRAIYCQTTLAAMLCKAKWLEHNRLDRLGQGSNVVPHRNTWLFHYIGNGDPLRSGWNWSVSSRLASGDWKPPRSSTTEGRIPLHSSRGIPEPTNDLLKDQDHPRPPTTPSEGEGLGGFDRHPHAPRISKAFHCCHRCALAHLP